MKSSPSPNLINKKLTAAKAFTTKKYLLLVFMKNIVFLKLFLLKSLDSKLPPTPLFLGFDIIELNRVVIFFILNWTKIKLRRANAVLFIVVYTDNTVDCILFALLCSVDIIPTKVSSNITQPWT